MHATAPSTLIAALAGAALALANPAPAPQPAITPAPLLHPHLLARQQHFSLPSSFSDDDDDRKSSHSHALPNSIACARKVVSLADTIPRETNRALARWMASVIPGAVTAVAGINGLDDIGPALTSQCSVYTITSTLVPPATLTSAYSSYMSVANEWYSSAGPVAHSLASSCGPGTASAMLEFMVVSDAESCSSAVMGLVNVLGGDGAGATTTEGSKSASATASGSESESGSGTAEATGATTGGTGTGASAPTGTTGTAGAATNTGAATGAGMREAGSAGIVVAAAAAVAGVVALL